MNPEKPDFPSLKAVRRDGSIIRAPQSKGPASGLKVLAHIHLYPPSHNAGAEWMLHALLKYGADVRGWNVSVITDQPPARSDSWQGIKVRHDRDARRVALDYRFIDVAITHLDATRKAMDLAARNGRPLVHLVHNHRQLDYHKVAPRNAALVLFNSEWLRDAVAWSGPSMVLHPPTRLADYEAGGHTFDGSANMATLLNVQKAKGSDTFFNMVQVSPSIKFLGVRGSYGHQEERSYPNLEMMDNQSDVVGSVYSKTKVLLVPSHYESWGRVAVEAACDGIPSICAPTPGLQEAGVTQRFVDPDDYVGWSENLITLMESEDAWTEASEFAKKRAIELDALVEEQLAAACERIESL